MNFSGKLRLLMLASALVVAAGCGSSSDSSKDTKDTKPAATQAASNSGASTQATQAAPQQSAASAAIDALDIASEKVTITFWHTQTGPNAEKLKSVIEGFQKKFPNITIDAQFTGNYTDNYKKVNAAIQGGGLPDLSVSYPSMVSDYQQSKKVVELDDYINSKKYGMTKEEMDDFIPSFLAESRNYPEFGNKFLSFPFTKSLLVMYYNASKLKEAGLKVPETWDDFMAACKKLTVGDAKCYTFENDASTFKGWVFSRGGKVITDDYKKWTLNDQAGVDALTMLQTMLKDGTAQIAAKQFAGQADFAAQKSMFTFGSTSGIPFYDKDAKEAANKYEWGIANLPHAASAKPATVLYGGSITMFKSDPKKQLAAWQFIKYFSSPEVTADWATNTGYVPVRKSAANSDIVKNRITQFPAFGVAMNQIAPIAIAEESTSGSQDVRLFIQDAMTAVTTDLNKKPKDALDEATAKAQKALNR